MKVRVLHFIWSANFGGIEKLVLHLAEAQLPDSEIEPFLMIGCRKGELIERIEQSEVQHCFWGLKSGFNFNPVTIRSLVKLFSRFDVLHLHTFNPAVALAALFSGRKIVNTIHGNFNLGRKIRLNDHIINFLRRLFYSFERVVLTYNSCWAAELASMKFKIRHGRGKVIYNGLLPEKPLSKNTVSADFKQLSGHYVVGTAGRFNESKRIDRLIRGFALFCANKADVMLLLVGDGANRAELLKLVNELGIRKCTLFTGYRQDVREWQNRMNVSVIPSSNESFGLAALETMSLGIPTILFSDAGGMLEIPGETFRDDIVLNENELSERLEYYYSHRNDSKIIMSAKRIQRAGIFTFDAMVKGYKECYHATSI